MEKLKISGSEKMYEIKSIMPHSKSVMKIVFPEDVDIPEEWGGDILLYTVGGTHCATLSSYETVYLQEDKTVYLSNDGSVYVPPTPPEPIPEPEPYVPTLEEIKMSKKAEISAACEQTIYSGCDVTLTDGQLYHFSLTEKDQLNLFGKQAQMATGVGMLEYHADGQPCQYYSAADMQLIIQKAMFHVSYHTTYCNSLNMWIARCESTEEAQQIFYGAEVPEEYQSEVLKAYLMQIAERSENEEDV